METEKEMSHFADTIPIDRYHQMIIDAIARGDKKLFAKMVCYPLERQYPVPDIENEEQMVRYFDTLFDMPFRKEIAKLDSSSWECIGWRGFMILDGEIWNTDPCIFVNYSSPTEQRYAEQLKKADMARLHPLLQGDWVPLDCYLIDNSESPDFEYSYARIDVSADQIDMAKPACRLALFKKGSSASDAPAMVLMGIHDFDGSMGIESFSFESDEYSIVIDPAFMEDGKPYFMMSRNSESDWDYMLPCRSRMQPFH